MKWLALAALAAMTAAGCASETHPAASFNQVRSAVDARLGARVQWNTNTADDQAAEQSFRDLLSRPLTSEAAVQIALLNNQDLQATFEDLGIAQADLVQAGLLRNPVLDLSVRFPDRNPARTYLNLAATENFLDVFLIPARKKIAAAQLDEATARVAYQVLSLAADTRSAFFAAQAAAQLAELRQQITDSSAASFELADKLHRAGNNSDRDYLLEKAQLQQAKLELAKSRAAVAEAREKLSQKMGVWGTALSWRIAGRLGELPDYDFDPASSEAAAIAQRQDLAAARSAIETQARSYHLIVDSRLWSQLDAGVDAERETDGQWRIGPTLTVPIPLFDQGQASVPRGAAMLRQSQKKYRALAVQVRSEARLAAARVATAKSAAEAYRDEVLPTQKQIVSEEVLRYNGMFASPFELFESRRAEIDAASKYIESLRDYWIARAELEHAIGGRPRPAPFSSAPGPWSSPQSSTSQPATAPAAHPPHHQHTGGQP